MTDIIQLLPDSVSNQIAAGEVVQRPASVIKELVENAIDAAASQIKIVLEDAGRTLIQVVDDGKGMSATDARLCFERHATSKIKKAEDLFDLHTLGFRGEALPSIASVAQVTLTTRTPDAEVGTRIVIEGSKLDSQEMCSCSHGANFEVRNLFFNVPARRKFLKSNQTELNNIMQEVERIALVNSSVEFEVYHNANLITQLPASTTKIRIANLFGRKLGEQLLDLNVDTSLIRIKGFVGRPETSRKKQPHQYFFVNGRYMRHPYFAKAVMEAYNQVIPEGEQVPYFIYLEIDPTQIDVNIHPTKTEIKFENEQQIWQVIMAATREVLGRFNAIPMLQFNMDDCPSIPVFESHTQANSPQVEINKSYNPFHTKGNSLQQPSTSSWECLYPTPSSNFEPADVFPPEDSVSMHSPAEEEKSPAELFEGGEVEFSPNHLQVQGEYILTAVRQGVMIVKQDRAHQRILHERYLKQMQGQPVSTQGLLFPEVLQFSVSDAMFIEQATDEIKALGFELSNLGGGSFAIHGIPSSLEGHSFADLFTYLIERMKEHVSQAESDLKSILAFALAQKSAIVVGQALSTMEMDQLINELFACENSHYTPDGKVIVRMMPYTDISRMFKKI